MQQNLMDEFRFKSVNLQWAKNQLNHKTCSLSSRTLVLRRGQAFQILVNFDGRAFNPHKDKLVFQVHFFQGSLSDEVPVSTRQKSTTQWSATIVCDIALSHSPRTISVLLLSPVSASVGVYTLSLRVETHVSVRTHFLCHFTLLCNPWCEGDSVFLNSEEHRDEYVMRDFGLLFKGTPDNPCGSPWLFDQYEKGILDICMNLLQLSPQHLWDRGRDLMERTSPVYISRVISAMTNSNDGDRGVLMGCWSREYNDGVNPLEWFSSADILWKWSESNFRPVKYGQCWVFAAVMCTVMRALGIPTRVVTNFNSAHDTNGNLMIEEHYSERGEKLESYTQERIWNFHVWVESWMKRPDLGHEFDGWQVLDPTPQERSTGWFRCGPASVKAIRQQKFNAQFDVPFVYAEVNADVVEMIMRDGKLLESRTDTKRVGSLICTKHPGSMQMLNITSQYKTEMDETLTYPLVNAYHDEIPVPSFITCSTATRCGDTASSIPNRIAVSLTLLETPVVGQSVLFKVEINNTWSKDKNLKMNINAQKKKYNRNPTRTFWKAYDELKIVRYDTQTFKYEISFSEYTRSEDLVNLAVVILDMETGERTMASKEFRIHSPTLSIQIKNSVIACMQQVGMVIFTSPFTIAVYGELTVTSSGILRDRISVTVQPRETIRIPFQFTPRRTGAKMLFASFVLKNLHCVLHGFKTINVK
ncbi:protein-glutamine gamma-glutamyltransferase 5-like [Triplophysa dalaica]|uniref:protein-glutamine gamma-glutamyltransferase 5-like n=1 Tax=Triplophysa dalaica TaxID=1582913 RepID=UPI0024DF75E9|nr:protein-glutamine gamma-glutamyltransferase 5-like [Triplophysa dalaica]